MASFAEKIKRSEIEKFDFKGEVRNLKLIQEVCTPKIRKVVVPLIEVASNIQKYSTEALEQSKIQILMLKNKFNIKDTTKEPFKISKFKKTTTSKVHLIDSGPEEISNCPVVEPKKTHFYRRQTKPKTDNRKPSTYSDIIESSPFQLNKEKWFYNKTDNKTTEIGLTVNDSLNAELLKKTIIEDLRNDLKELEKPNKKFDSISDSISNQNELQNSRTGPIEPLTLEQRKQNIDRLPGAKIVKKANDNTIQSVTKTAPQKLRDSRHSDQTKKINLPHDAQSKKITHSSKETNNSQQAFPSTSAQSEKVIQEKQSNAGNTISAQQSSRDPRLYQRADPRLVKKSANRKEIPKNNIYSLLNQSSKNFEENQRDVVSFIVENGNLTPPNQMNTKRSISEEKSECIAKDIAIRETLNKDSSTSKKNHTQHQSQDNEKQNLNSIEKNQNIIEKPLNVKLTRDPRLMKKKSDVQTNHTKSQMLKISDNTQSKSKNYNSDNISKELKSTERVTNGTTVKEISIRHDEKVDQSATEGENLLNQIEQTSDLSGLEPDEELAVQSTNKILQDTPIHEEEEINGNDHETDEDTDNADDSLQITLELASVQKGRNEKKRKAPSRENVAKRKSKRLRKLPAEIKTEQLPPEETNTISETTDLHTCNELGVTSDTPVENTTCETTDFSINTTLPAIPNEVPEEISEIKKEILESNIPILNVPVIESQESYEDCENLSSSQIKEELYFDESHSEEIEMFIKTETPEIYNDLDNASNLESKLELECFIEQNINTPDLKVKQELIEISEEEAEAFRTTIENISFVNHRISFQLCCNTCKFVTIDRLLFAEHLNMHNELQWTGFCSSCDAYVIGYDTNLIEEYNHMLKVHVKLNDIIVLDNDTFPTTQRPLLKIRNFAEDHLSVKK